MVVTRSRSRRAPWALVVAVCAATLLGACSSSSHSSSQPSVPATSTPSASTSSVAPSETAAAPLGVTWMTGFAAPGTPARYNKVGVIKVGPSDAKNVLGARAGNLGRQRLLRARSPSGSCRRRRGWQVWSVERRENLLEDQSELTGSSRARSRATAALQLLPRLPEEPGGQAALPDDPRLDRRVREAVGHERRGRRPAHA